MNSTLGSVVPLALSPLCTRYSILLNTRSCLKQLKFFQNFLQSNVVICFINCVCKNMVNDYCALKGYMWHHNSLRSIICGINLVPDDSNLRNGIISPLSRLSRWNIKSSWDKRTNEMIKWNRFEKLTIIYNYYSGFLLVLIQVTLPMRILEGVKFTVSRYQSKVWGFSRQHLPSLWIVTLKYY